MKTSFKGKRFQEVEDIKINVTAELNAVPLWAFACCFRNLLKRFNKCIQAGGDDLE
jgi:hypothetical protein